MSRRRASLVAAMAAALCLALAPSLLGQRAGAVDVEFIDFTAATSNAHPHDPAFSGDGALWYTGQARQQPRARRSGIRSGPRVQASRLPRAARPGRGSRRQHLVHGQRRRPDRQARSEDRPGDGIQDAGSGGARSAHADLRSQRHAVVYRAGRQLRRQARAEDRSSHAEAGASSALGSVRHRGDVERHTRVRSVRDEQDRHDQSADDGDHRVHVAGRERGRVASPSIATTSCGTRTIGAGISAASIVKTKATKEYPSPGGRDAQPYGITTTADGAVWYSESGVEPNTLVRFDPATEQFQKWNIPNGGGVVRHMVTAPNGDLLLAYSGVNKVGRVRVKKTT